MDIDGLGPAIISLLLENGRICGIADLYSLRAEEIADLDRMGEKSAENLVRAIEASKSRGLERLLFALGIRQVGAVASEAIASRFRTLEACFAAGARLARRGEFTERAFLNGKLDLSAAEAVIDLVDARTDRAADEAQSRLRGVLSDRYESLYRDAIECSSRMEHLLDVDEGEIPEGTMESYSGDLLNLKSRISKLLSTAREGKILRDGALVVLAGRPNAGKSSLMNALLGENRAIVSDVAGTTRDSIEEGLDIDGWPIRIVDTAGLRATDDAIEAEGVVRAEELMAKADIVVALDCDVPGAIRVHAKCDLDQADFHDSGAIRVSAKTGEGLQFLKDAIAAKLRELSSRASEDVADVTARQTDLLAKALAALEGTDPADPVLAANALRIAAQSIGEIIGKTYSEDLLDSLFSRFCVGK
jgi:tRNA modification GTPase